jgi:hypothetical protein
MKARIMSDEFDVRKPDHLLLPAYPLTNFPGISYFGLWYGISYLHLPNTDVIWPKKTQSSNPAD